MLTVTCLDVISVYSGECEAGWQCKPRDQCPAFQQKDATLKTLTHLSSEWFELASKLVDLKCAGEKNWICCEKGELDNLICIHPAWLYALALLKTRSLGALRAPTSR